MLQLARALGATILISACTTVHSERYALVQNGALELRTTLRQRPSSATYLQDFGTIENQTGMDRQGGLRRHVLRSGDQTFASVRRGEELHLPQGIVPAPAKVYHLSTLAALPVLVPELRALGQNSATQTMATTAPSGDMVAVAWTCILRTPKERHYVARYEVTTAELRYAKIRGRWTLESAEYSEREFVQRWNRIPRR